MPKSKLCGSRYLILAVLILKHFLQAQQQGSTTAKEPATAATAPSPKIEPEPMEVEEDEDQDSKADRENKIKAQKEKELGNAAYKARRFDDAIKNYDAAIDLDNTDISFLTNRYFLAN